MILLKVHRVIFCIKEYVLWRSLPENICYTYGSVHLKFRSFYYFSNEPEKLKLILSQVEVPVFSYGYFTHNELFHIKSLRK